MATPVSKSLTPLVFDALPALKVRHYLGRSRVGNIYTSARLYVLGDALALSLCSFERAPEPESRVAFCVGGPENATLLLSLSRQDATLTLCGAPQREKLDVPGLARFSGQDEQGWYWGASLALEGACLRQAGVDLTDDGAFRATLVKYRTDEDAFGSAFPVQAGEDPFDAAHFGLFQVVAY